MIIKHMQRNILWGKSKSENKRKAKRTRCEGRKSGKKGGKAEALAMAELFILAISFLSIKCCRKSQSRTHRYRQLQGGVGRVLLVCLCVCVYGCESHASLGYIL